MKKICDTHYPIYGLIKNLVPYLSLTDKRYNKFPSSKKNLNYRNHNLWRAFVDFRFDNDKNVASS